MKIVVVGGGSGGHITPVVAVVEEIWKIKPRTRIEFWTDKKFYKNVTKITSGMGPSLTVRKIAAGKLRRYTNFTFITYLQHFDVVLANILDMFKITAGFFQSFIRLISFKPDAIFLKGGYVCLPVGIAARLLRIPYVIHDSDTVPGLTNRILAKHAVKIATGMPLEHYTYPSEKAEWTGIPTSAEFLPITKSQQKSLKRELDFPADDLLTVITGGSLGAQHINEAVREILPELLKVTNVLLVAGRERYPEMMDLKKFEVWEKGKLKSNFRMIEFSSEMSKLFGAADIVVSRAGASSMTELAAMKKAVIMVPNHKLPGKHQVKNAEAYAKSGAAIVVEDERMVDQPGLLLSAVKKLAKNPASREDMAKKLQEFSKSDAAKRLAEMVISTAGAK